MKGRTQRASGGKTEEGVKVSDTDKGAKWYSGDESNVKKEAEEPTGFKKGGKVAKKGDMKAVGEKGAKRLDKACRNSGGRIARASGGVATGSRSPFAVSEKTSDRPGFKGRDMND